MIAWITKRFKRSPLAAENDKLELWEELPLGLALIAQSYVVGLWYFASVSGASKEIDLFVAIGAGLALDLIVVTTVMGRRAGRSSGWSWATSLGAFGCSALIAMDRYGWEYRSLLHVAFPLVVFLYSQHLATPRKRPLETLPERSSAPQPIETSIGTPVAPALVQEEQEAFIARLLDEALTPPQAMTLRDLEALTTEVLPSDALAISNEHHKSPLDELLTQANLDRPQALALLNSYGIRNAASAYRGLRALGKLPEAMALDDFTPLYEELTSKRMERYPCPHCGAPLKSKQSLGAATHNGYCLNCKTRQAA
jgi:hypothetical protein